MSDKMKRCDPRFDSEPMPYEGKAKEGDWYTRQPKDLAEYAELNLPPDAELLCEFLDVEHQKFLLVQRADRTFETHHIPHKEPYYIGFESEFVRSNGVAANFGHSEHGSGKYLEVMKDEKGRCFVKANHFPKIGMECVEECDEWWSSLTWDTKYSVWLSHYGKGFTTYFRLKIELLMLIDRQGLDINEVVKRAGVAPALIALENTRRRWLSEQQWKRLFEAVGQDWELIKCRFHCRDQWYF